MNTTTTNPLLSQAQIPASSFQSILAGAASQSNERQEAPDCGAGSQSGEETANAGSRGGQTSNAPKAAAQKNVPQAKNQAAAMDLAAGGAQVVRSGAKSSDAAAGNLASSRAAKENPAAVCQTDLKTQPAPMSVIVPPAVPPQAPEVATTMPAPLESRVTGAEVKQVPTSDVADKGQSVGAPKGNTDDGTAQANSVAPKNQGAPIHGDPVKAADAGTRESEDEAAGTASDTADSTATASQPAVVGNAVAQKVQFLAALPNVSLPSGAATLPSAVEMNRAGKTAQDMSTGATTTPNATPTATPDKSHAAGAVSSSPSAGTPSAPQADGSTGQHAQIDGVHATAANVGKASDSAPIPVPMQATSQARHESANDASHPAEVMHLTAAAADTSEGAASAGINTAKLIQTMSQTEMHIGLRSAEFGDISIRTAFSQQQMFAQISVDHGDLGRAIAAATPGLQARLGGDFGVNASIQVHQSGASFSGGGGTASQQQPQRSSARQVREDSGAVSAEGESVALRMGPVGSGEYRLDIRA